MDKIWLKSYPPGVPAEIDWRQHQSIGELFARNCERFRDRPAYHNMGATLSFGELDRLSQQFGAWLQSKGLAKGTRVAKVKYFFINSSGTVMALPNMSLGSAVMFMVLPQDEDIFRPSVPSIRVMVKMFWGFWP